MKQILTFALTVIMVTTALGQNFEGKITYQNSFKSKVPSVKDEQFNSMMGTRQEYFIKAGDYKSVSNGTLMQWQLYINKDNKLYNKMSNSESVLWNDGSANDDSIISYQLNKGAVDVLGYKCDELILNTKSGTQKYYFNSKLAADKDLYVNHKFGNWYEYLKLANALPLKIIVDSPQFTMESIAMKVEPMNLDAKEFVLPPNVKTEKNPY